MSEHLCIFCNQPGTTEKSLSSIDSEKWVWQHASRHDCIRALQYRIETLSKESDYWQRRFQKEMEMSLRIQVEQKTWAEK